MSQFEFESLSPRFSYSFLKEREYDMLSKKKEGTSPEMMMGKKIDLKESKYQLDEEMKLLTNNRTPIIVGLGLVEVCTVITVCEAVWDELEKIDS